MFLTLWSFNRLQPYVFAQSKNSTQIKHTTDTVANFLKKLQPYVFLLHLIVFIGELYYKIKTKTGIFMLQPCHVTHFLQLLILKFNEKSSLVLQLFRLQMYFIPGAFLATIFPALGERSLFEIGIFYVQHFLIILVPIFLIASGRFIPEKFTNFTYAAFGYAAFVLYHYVVLQPLSYVTLANINYMLCPSKGDPFNSRFWRIAGVFYLIVVLPVFAKVYTLLGFCFIFLVRYFCYEQNKKLE